MAFLRVEKKKSGAYLRIVASYKDGKIPRHRTLHSLGKVEDYPANQLERIATKLLEVAGLKIEQVLPQGFSEVNRLNYGYAMVIKKLWKQLQLDQWVRDVNTKSRLKFDWISALQIMIAERINDPCSKRQASFNQVEYYGFSDKAIELHQFYRCLDTISERQESLKKHLFTKQRTLFSSKLDVVFYDVTTLYFDSEIEVESSLRQKGYSKDGKAHKTQIVLGLLVDKLRNPISYHLYKGNTYEGKTMVDALDALRKHFDIDRVIVVADSAMIDSDNRAMIEAHEQMSYIIGDRIKNLPKSIADPLLDANRHKALTRSANNELLTYNEVRYKGRRIVCTYSSKRAKKDAHQREKLITKARALLSNPSQLKRSKKRGASRFITSASEGHYVLDTEKIAADARWDGYKAIATNSSLSVRELLKKYGDLFEVEHAFRTLKSQLEIRPIFHWTNKRIEGHIAMCFMAYTMLNLLRYITGLQNRSLVKTLDKMQVSVLKESQSEELVFMRSKINENQERLIKKLQLQRLKDVTSQRAVAQYFI